MVARRNIQEAGRAGVFHVAGGNNVINGNVNARRTWYAMNKPHAAPGVLGTGRPRMSDQSKRY
jgi:hypothetical protein